MLYSYWEKKFSVFSDINVLLSALETFSARLHVNSLPLLGSLYWEWRFFSFCLSSFSNSLSYQFHPVFLVLFVLFCPQNCVALFNFFLFFCTPKYTSKNHMDACYQLLWCSSCLCGDHSDYVWSGLPAVWGTVIDPSYI